MMAKGTRDHRLALFMAVALPLLLAFALRLSFLGDAEHDADGFYHAAMADLGWDHFSAKEMPHVTMSLWTHSFSDKELFFHVLLAGIRRGERALGLAGFPFHFSAFPLLLLVFLAFAAAAVRLRIRHAWAYAVLMVCLAPVFTARLLMLRPHVMAIALMLLACAVLAGRPRPAQRWQALALGFLFAWSYSNPHFLLLPAGAFALPELLRGRWRALLLPALCLAGILVGYLLHPQFPNTFYTWKVQCFDVPRLMLAGGGEDVGLGTEMVRRGVSLYLLVPGLIAVTAMNLGLTWALARRCGWRRLPRDLVAVMIIALVSFAGIALSIRVLEYACPFALLAAGVCVSAAGRHPKRLFPRAWPGLGRHRGVAMALLAGIIVVVAVHAQRRLARAGQSAHKFRPLEDFTRWTRTVGLPVGTVIGNLNWSDFPVLLYSAPQFRYLHGLDPMFGMAAFPERVRALERFRLGRQLLPPAELRAVIGTPFAYVSPRNWALARDMAAAGFVIVYQGDDGWLFCIDDVREPGP